jgi:predicted kinase
MDRTRALLIPDSPHDRRDRRIAYRAIHWAAELLLRCGQGVILDAPYGHEEERREVDEMAARIPARLRLIECSVSPETAVERFRMRGPDPIRRDLNEERVRELVRAYNYRRTGLLLDTDRKTVEECFAALLLLGGDDRQSAKP